MVPPSRGPRLVRTRTTELDRPSATDRSGPAYRADRVVVVSTGMAPAPRPCSNRPSTSSSKDGASEDRPAPMASMTPPARNGVRVPTESATRPQTAVDAASARAKDVSTHALPAVDSDSSSDSGPSTTLVAEVPIAARPHRTPRPTAARVGDQPGPSSAGTEAGGGPVRPSLVLTRSSSLGGPHEHHPGS